MRFRIVSRDPPWWRVLAAGWFACAEAAILRGIPNIGPLVPPIVASLTFICSLAYYLWRFHKGSYLDVSQQGLRRAEPIPILGSRWDVSYADLSSVQLHSSGRVTLQVRYAAELARRLPPERQHFEIHTRLADVRSFETALRLYAPAHVKISWVSALPAVAPYDVEAAGFLPRAIAFALDAAFGSLLAVTVAVMLMAGGVSGSWVWLGSPAVWFMYTWAGNALGQSEGKRIMNVFVHAPGKNPPGLWTGLRRALGQFAMVLSLGIGYLWILTNPKRRGLHDLLAGTRVFRIVWRQAAPQPAAPPARGTQEATNP
jgi:uncharacterized RDD family membrane protein YckC